MFFASFLVINNWQFRNIRQVLSFNFPFFIYFYSSFNQCNILWTKLIIFKRIISMWLLNFRGLDCLISYGMLQKSKIDRKQEISIYVFWLSYWNHPIIQSILICEKIYEIWTLCFNANEIYLTFRSDKLSTNDF